MCVVKSLRTRDAGLAALRRSCRAGIVAPGLFAFGVEGIGNVTMAIFSAFGSISLLLFVDFAGPLRERLAAQGSLVVAGAVLVCLGTLVSGSVWMAAVIMALVGFGVLFSGVVSSVIAGSSTSLLAGFILAVTLPGPVGSIPDRLAGYLMAGAASLIAITVLWPAPVRGPLRLATARSCSLLAERLRAEVGCVRGGFAADRRVVLDELVAEASAAVTALRKSFFDTPYRPTGLTTEARTLVRLVDEVVWLEEILERMPPGGPATPSDVVVCEVVLVAADLLERGADRLESDDADPTAPRLDQKRLRDARTAMERAVTSALPAPVATDGQSQSVVAGFISSLEPSFRAQEMSFAVSSIAENIELGVAARSRRWWERALGRQPDGVSSPLSSAQERAGAHIEPHSVWLHNSLRGAFALGLAVLVAEVTGVQHSFWVVFGTLAVLRSNALLTGQNALRALLGTVVGIIVGSGLIFALGSNTTVFWILLPPAIVFTGLAPTAISFAAGQAGFTAALLILFNIIEPAGWTIGLVRFEDIAIGCAVSVGVGMLFWPRGAGAALGQATAEAFAESAGYLSRAIEYGVTRSDGLVPAAPTPEDERRNAAAAARRLDDAFRCFLAERGTKHIALADVTALMTTVAVLRLTADAIVDLWEQDDDGPTGDHTTARADIVRSGLQVCKWYQEAARALSGYGEVPERLTRDETADERLINAVRRDLFDGGGQGTSTAIRMIWTAGHIDVAQQLQMSVVGPARAAAALQNRMNTVAGRAVARRQPPHTTSA
ncbi:FUSC family protein [Streptomyces sp. NBC_01217]|uniref:FUSC family protein n=1 Tax=Streptomyces sp. NBC_01217 TaxID=2903779 RepID=UPI002E0EA0F2|nr:FUSC family protein [Streptomyces sp. NBC_01217]